MTLSEIKWNTIYNCDCIEGMGALAADSVDLIFADPPFNIGYKYDVYHDKLNDDDYWEWSKRWMSEAYRILKPDGTFWLAIGDEYAAELKITATRELGFTCRSWVIWYYTFGVNCKQNFTRSHTHLFYFVKNANQFTFNDKAIRIPSARQLVYNDKRANPRGRLPDNTWILRPQVLEHELGSDKDTWFVSRVCGTFKEREGWHGCQMPESILERIITVSSPPNGIVLDPFLGSGTTVVVAKKLGRTFLGFELSKEYWEQCQTRLNLFDKNVHKTAKNKK
ncbi:MAG: site-specific DNA-methyltransferase [Planctomycetaceae bacterium]|jgi:site-specific DNA-methyltransferase (adenine-specific)|nr:site-specific DNA-methyltransferase [Planctomycetaceae bacterium]